MVAEREQRDIPPWFRELNGARTVPGELLIERLKSITDTREIINPSQITSLVDSVTAYSSQVEEILSIAWAKIAEQRPPSEGERWTVFWAQLAYSMLTRSDVALAARHISPPIQESLGLSFDVLANRVADGIVDRGPPPDPMCSEALQILSATAILLKAFSRNNGVVLENEDAEGLPALPEATISIGNDLSKKGISLDKIETLIGPRKNLLPRGTVITIDLRNEEHGESLVLCLQEGIEPPQEHTYSLGEAPQLTDFWKGLEALITEVTTASILENR